MSEPDGTTGPGAGVDVSVVSTAHDVADARLHRHCAAFVRAGLRVEVIGRGRPADGPPDVTVTTLPRRGKFGRARDAATLPFRARGRALLTLDPDLVPGATLRRRTRGGVLVVDVHEDYLALLADRAWARGPAGLAARLVARGATALTRRADLAVVADEHVPPRTARHRLVVRNLPDPGYLPPPGEPDAEPRAVYIGDVRRSRGLQAMVAAVAAAPPWKLDIIGPVAAADADWLDGWLASAPEADRVRVHGRLAPAAAWALARGAWAGLALLEDTPAFRAAVPTKLYEYLGCGFAVLATPLPRMADLVAESGAGRVVGDPEAASATLRGWFAAPGELAKHRAAAVDWAERHLAGASPYDQLAREVRSLVRPQAGLPARTD